MDIGEMIILALGLFGGAYGLILYTPLWWLGIIAGAFASLLSLRVAGDLIGGG